MSEINDKIKSLWQQALNGVEPDEDSSFFDKGGNSLQAVILLEMIKSEFGVELGIVDLYNHETLSDFTSFLNSKLTRGELKVEGCADTYIVPRDAKVRESSVIEALDLYDANRNGEIEKYYRIMQFQRYFMLMSQNDYLGILCSIIDIKNAESENSVVRALKTLVNEQEILRTGMTKDRESFVLYSPNKWEIPVIRREENEENWEKIVADMENIRNCIKDFSEGRMMSRIIVLKYSEEDYQVRVYTHHCIWDRMSHLLVAERIEEILKGNVEVEGIRSYSEFSDSSRPNRKEIKAFYRNVIRNLRRPLLRYLSYIKRLRAYNITVCWTPDKELLEEFKKHPVETGCRLYIECINKCANGRIKRLPVGVLTNGRDKRNANTLGLWINTILVVYDYEKGELRKIDGGKSLAAEDNQTVVYEMLPLWLFKKLAYSLPINNYVGLFPDYQDANRDY
ncbi:MAG: acyl carrier protein, partial [Eubacterium sp.]|nr:acyl carrier protein [Eubacterium sp.]